jgi:hypothetical protein
MEEVWENDKNIIKILAEIFLYDGLSVLLPLIAFSEAQ